MFKRGIFTSYCRFSRCHCPAVDHVESTAQDHAPEHAAPQPFAPLAVSCYAMIDNGPTVYSSTDGSAVQQAVDLRAQNGALLKLAGTCTGMTA